MEAGKISSKAAHIGFDWPDINGLFEKLAEETKELKEQLSQLASDSLQPPATSQNSRRSCMPGSKMKSATFFS